jgi:hypothetical protein
VLAFMCCVFVVFHVVCIELGFMWCAFVLHFMLNVCIGFHVLCRELHLLVFFSVMRP